MHQFFELHIEQGPILEAEGFDIGVVTHGQGLNWIQVTLTGRESHTGSTPMPMRKNAGLGMARITELVHKIAMENQPQAVGAIGQCNVYPNSLKMTPGKVVFTIDFRSPSFDTQDRMEAALRTGANEIASELGLEIEMEKVGHFDPVTFNKDCVNAIQKASDRLGYSSKEIISGAGHDACWINRSAPTAMIMCPCVDGLSHNEADTLSLP
jgi:N-carbamoyl-L-amino-acid hydrolase